MNGKNNDRCSIDIASSKVVISFVSRCYRCLLVVIFSNISNNYNSHNSNTSINIMYGSPQYVMIPSLCSYVFIISILNCQ